MAHLKNAMSTITFVQFIFIRYVQFSFCITAMKPIKESDGTKEFWPDHCWLVFKILHFSTSQVNTLPIQKQNESF